MNKDIREVIGFILICFGVALITHFALDYFQTSDDPVKKSSEELKQARLHNYELSYKLGYLDGSNNMLKAYDPKKDTRTISKDFNKKRIEDSISFRNDVIIDK